MSVSSIFIASALGLQPFDSSTFVSAPCFISQAVASTCRYRTLKCSVISIIHFAGLSSTVLDAIPCRCFILFRTLDEFDGSFCHSCPLTSAPCLKRRVITSILPCSGKCIDHLHLRPVPWLPWPCGYWQVWREAFVEYQDRRKSKPRKRSPRIH
jgi:hypothetical protein